MGLARPHLTPSLHVCLPSCSIGETVEEVNDSGFNGGVPTLQAQLLADDSMLQVGGWWLWWWGLVGWWKRAGGTV